MQILISYWTNQTVFVFTGHSEPEQLGVCFEQRGAIISEMEGDQAELLRIFVDVEGNLYGKLSVICSRIGRKLEAVIEGASNEDKRNYNDLMQVVKKNYRSLQIAVHAL